MPAPFKWTEEKRREMIAAYENGEGTNAIAKRFHLGHESVASLLHEQGIILRSHSEYARRHICNHSYFHSITTEAQAYWLGFLTADGCITTGNRINIVLGITDCSHLSKLKEALEASQKVSLSNRSCSLHYWRGTLDGDGYISKDGTVLALVGDYEIVLGFQAFVLSHCPYVKAKIYRKEHIYSFKLMRDATKYILQVIYKDATVYLDRKYERAQQVL